MVNGLSGERMLIGLAIGIAVLIFLVLRTKSRHFLLIISTVVVGVIGGMPLTNITIEVDGVEKTFGIVNSITSGFGGTLGSIGIIIGFGVMMGQIFEVTGAAKRMAHTFLKLFGKKREEEALALTGFLVSIPIFCDSGFVVLAPIAKAISKATKKSVIGLGTALAAGLVITHSLVPPTPGPLGVCGIFGVDVGKFILLTLVLALPMAIACIAYSRLFLSKKYYRIPNDEGEIVEMPYQEPNYEAAFAMDMTGVPGALESFMPLIIPIILILINTVATAMGKTEGFMNILVFLGQPIVAVGLGLIVAILTLGRSLDRHEALAEMEKEWHQRNHHVSNRWRRSARPDHQRLRTWNIYGRRACKDSNPDHYPAASDRDSMRFIQGSGTVAMTTAASITAPIIAASGVSPILGAVACCVGSLFFGYFNDSYFWVVNRTLGVSEAKDQLTIWSVTSTVAWAVGVIEVLILNIFM